MVNAACCLSHPDQHPDQHLGAPCKQVVSTGPQGAHRHDFSSCTYAQAFVDADRFCLPLAVPGHLGSGARVSSCTHSCLQRPGGETTLLIPTSHAYSTARYPPGNHTLHHVQWREDMCWDSPPFSPSHLRLTSSTVDRPLLFPMCCHKTRHDLVSLDARCAVLVNTFSVPASCGSCTDPVYHGT